MLIGSGRCSNIQRTKDACNVRLNTWHSNRKDSRGAWTPNAHRGLLASTGSGYHWPVAAGAEGLALKGTVFQDQEGWVGIAEAPGPAWEKIETMGALGTSNRFTILEAAEEGEAEAEAEAEAETLETAPTVLAAPADPPSLPIPALATTDDATLPASITVTFPSPEGQSERTAESLDERLPELATVLGMQDRPRAELHADLSAVVTANTWPESFSDGVLTLAKTFPSIRTLESLPTSKAWPVFRYQ